MRSSGERTNRTRILASVPSEADRCLTSHCRRVANVRIGRMSCAWRARRRLRRSAMSKRVDRRRSDDRVRQSDPARARQKRRSFQVAPEPLRELSRRDDRRADAAGDGP